MDKSPLRGPEDLRRLRPTDAPETVAEADVLAAGADPADVAVRADTDHPTPRDADPEDTWVERGEIGEDAGPTGGLPPTPGR
jgi:hypothetical protein